MNSIQLGTTLVAPTGTGLLFGSYGQDADKAEWFYGSGATRQKIQLTRVRPKPTATFPGVERFEMKRTQYYTVNSIEYTAVTYAGGSIAVPISYADRTAIATGLYLMVAGDGTMAYTNPLLYAVQTGALPV